MWVRGMDRAFKFRLAAIYIYIYTWTFPVRQSDMAMEKEPFINGFAIKTSIAMFDNQRVA